MPQHDLFTDRPVTSLVIEVHDQTLLALSDATEVIARHVDIKGDTSFVGSTTLCGVEQDLLETLLSRVLIAHRYGSVEDVRMAMVRTRKEAREHARAHSRE